ncbi:protein trafficking Pga2 [Aspergillus granulosus]|uniref:Protein trafficking Pga2 n=1 Tax=Aspergillus granulosus TaxID=176169 RepID=A0ABR4GYE0_9EURO
MLIRRFCKNLYHSFADMTMHRWTKVGLCVVGYILIRPYIEAFFKERAEAAARGKAKVSANVLRGGAAADGEGKVLGEVENTDDEVEGEDAEEFATASGVPEWGKNARKRAKKHQRSLRRRRRKLRDLNCRKSSLWSFSIGESEDDKKV